MDFDINESLKHSLSEYFSCGEAFDRIFPVITRTSEVSLRLLEYFVVNHCRLHLVRFPFHGQSVDVYASYRKQLKLVSKNVFDPFRRGEKFVVRHGSDAMTTTWAQLSFFRWVLENGVLEYIENHLADLQGSMKQFLGKSPVPSPPLGSTGRNNLQASPTPLAQRTRRVLLPPVPAKARVATYYTALRTDTPSDSVVKYTVTFD